MKTSIIRVKSYLNNDLIECGTGIVISPHYVLTAKHILSGDYHTVVLNGEEKNALIEKSNIANGVAALLKMETEIEVDSEQLKFTDEELLNEDIKWYAEGFIGTEQEYHTMSGNGITHTENSEYGIDFKLLNIGAGYAENYKGMSGSPVICNDRIVGMLQIQSLEERGLLGLGMISTNLFKDLLPVQFISVSKYIEDFEDCARHLTEKAIEKNLKSKKYIPDIFVEEGQYKESFRYFSEPKLFIRRIIDEITNFDLNNINKVLSYNNEQELDFSELKEYSSKDSILDTCELLIQRLNDAIQKIKRASQKIEYTKASIEKRYMQGFGLSFMGSMSVFERIISEISFFKYRTILFTNDAGQGKTNFLCDFADNFLLKKKIPVLYYNAYDFHEPLMNLIKKALTVNETYKWEYVKQALTKKWECEYRSIIIIIDGLNENTALDDFCGYIVDFVKEAQELPFIKVALSTRNEFLKERFGRLNPDELGDCFYHLNMNQRSEEFMERIFKGYLNFFDIHIAKDAISEKVYKILAKDTLLLRFFCEVNQGKKQVSLLNIHKYSLFKKYYEMKKKEINFQNSSATEEIFDKLIDHICKYMIENQQFFKVPRKKLENEELKILDRLLESDIIFKQEDQVQEGLLKEIEIVLSFTFDEFRDYCITRYILKSHCEKELLKLWNRMHSNHWTIAEGMERYTFFLAKTEIKEILPIIQKGEDYYQIYWKNVWELEEEDITPEDIKIWNNEFLSCGTNAPRIVSFLLGRRNRNYCKKINVDLLFEMLDQLADNTLLFEKLMKRLFINEKIDKYGIKSSPKETVIHCNILIQNFRKDIGNKDFISENKDFLRLTIYIMQIDTSMIKNLWADIYLTSPEDIEEIVKIYIPKKKLSSLIYYNIQLILDEIISKCQENENLRKIREELEKKHKNFDYSDINKKINSIWNY